MLGLKDVKIQFIRGSGPGGQRKNKVSTGVRMTHIPTGTVVEATEEREQSKNREVAFRRLEERLAAAAEAEKARLKAETHKAKPPATFGRSRRTYRLLHPESVTDDSGHSETNVQGVLDGQIDGFLRAQNE